MACVVALAWWFHTTGRGDLPWTDVGSAHRWLYRSPLPRLGDFTVGVLAALLVGSIAGSPRAPRVGRWLAAMAALLFVVAMSQQSWLYAAWSWDAGYLPIATALMVGLAMANGTGALTWVLSRPSIVLLGEASYAFYLIHVTVFSALGGGAWKLGLTREAAAFEIIVFGATVAFAVGVHVCLEGPARRMVRASGDHLIARARRRPAAP